jgi:hypothetical protein
MMMRHGEEGAVRLSVLTSFRRFLWASVLLLSFLYRWGCKPNPLAPPKPAKKFDPAIVMTRAPISRRCKSLDSCPTPTTRPFRAPVRSMPLPLPLP